MTALSMLFRQKNVIIGAKSTKKGPGGQVIDELKDSLVKTWTATTSKGITVDATINEEHLTSCDITENPVEDGAKITDHVQLKPAQLTIEGVISDTPLGYAIIGNIQNIAKSVTSIFGGSIRSIDAYNDLVTLQKSRDPFVVVTGLKRYENMIMTELSVPRTSQTGAAIHFRAIMREIRIVKSKTTGTANLSTSVSSLGATTKDFGQTVTGAVPAVGSPAKTVDPSSTEGSWLNRNFGVFGQ